MALTNGLTKSEIQALRATCRAAAQYHDSPATKGLHCLTWCFCGCERAKCIREADVAICKLEYAPRPAKAVAPMEPVWPSRRDFS